MMSNQTALRAETPFPAEELRVLAQRLARQIVHVLEDEQAGYQPARQRRQLGPVPTHRTKAPRNKVPIDLRSQPHQGMAQV